MNDLMEAALSYAAKGIFVFPCKPRSKEPATKNGFKNATTDQDQIRAWWDENPQYNIAIPTGKVNGFWVLDVDGEEGYESYAQFRGEIPLDTPQVGTGKGFHLYFAYSDDVVDLRGTVGSLPGLDVRTNGNYVVGPPSVHESGKAYVWRGNNRELRRHLRRSSGRSGDSLSA